MRSRASSLSPFKLFSQRKNSIHDAAFENDVQAVINICKRDEEAANLKEIQHLQTPLHVACMEGHGGLVEVLIGFKADPNQRDCNGWTAMHFCCSSGKQTTFDICKLLVKLGKASVDALTNTGATPLHYLVRKEQANSSLQEFEENIKFLIDNGTDINSQSIHGETPLHQAVARGRINAVRYLINFGANLNLRTKDGETALHIAIKNNSRDIAFYLIDCKADPTLEANDGCCRQYCNKFHRMNILAYINAKTARPQSAKIPWVPKLKQSRQGRTDSAPNSIGETTEDNKKFVIDPELVEKASKMGYEAHIVMAAIYALYKRAEPINFDNLLLELDYGSASNQNECKVCLAETINCVVLPCRHSSLCLECAESCKNTTGLCPICRQEISEIIQIFVS